MLALFFIDVLPVGDKRKQLPCQLRLNNSSESTLCRVGSLENHLSFTYLFQFFFFCFSTRFECLFTNYYFSVGRLPSAAAFDHPIWANIQVTLQKQTIFFYHYELFTSDVYSSNKSLWYLTFSFYQIDMLQTSLWISVFHFSFKTPNWNFLIIYTCPLRYHFLQPLFKKRLCFRHHKREEKKTTPKRYPHP
jgi:hypothetical protein